MYGWFAGLICVGSCVGVVNWLALLLSRTSFSQGIDALPGLSIQQPNATISSFSDEMANAARWQTVTNVLFPLELVFCTISKLLVLCRLIDFANPDANNEASRRWQTAERFAVLVVLICNLIGLAGNAVSAHEWMRIPPLLSNGATAYTANPDLQMWIDTTLRPVYATFQQGSQMLVYQETAESAMLLIMVVMYAVSGFLCARRLSNVLKGLPDSRVDGTVGASARWLRLQIVATVSFVFLTLLLRTAWTIFAAVANVGQAHGSNEIPQCIRENELSQPCECSNQCVSPRALLKVT
jgi:hypothetical protein